MVLLRKFCGCYDTRQGSIAISILYFIIGIVFTIITIVALANWDSYSAQVEKSYSNYSYAHHGEYFFASSIISLILLILYCLVCLVLLHAVRNDRRLFMLPWIFWTGLNVILGLGGLVIQLFMGAAAGGILVILAIIAMFVLYLFTIYCLMVVISHYQYLRDIALGSVPKY